MAIKEELNANGGGNITLEGASELSLGGAKLTSGNGTINIGDNTILDENLDVATEGNVNFVGTIDSGTSGNKSLTIDSDGITTFGDKVGDQKALVSLDIRTSSKADALTRIKGGSVSTIGNQTYGDEVSILDLDTKFTSASGDIKINSKLDANKHSLDVVATTGNINFGGDVINAEKVTLKAGQDITTEKLTASGDVSLDASNDITTNGDVEGGKVALKAGNDITTASLNATNDTLTITAGNDFLSGNAGNPVKLQAKNKVLIKSVSGATTITGDVESTDGGVEILANTNKLITVKGDITSDNSAVTIGAINDEASFDLTGKITAKKDIIIYRDIKGGDIEIISDQDNVNLHGDISTEGEIKLGAVVVEGAPDVFNIASGGKNIVFESIKGTGEKGLGNFTLQLNAAKGRSKEDEDNGEIKGAVNVRALNLAGSGGNITGNIVIVKEDATNEEKAGSIRGIKGYFFGNKFFFNGDPADFGFDQGTVRTIIQSIAPLKTVLNDKLFSAGLSKGKLDEDMTASDAKISDSKGAEPEECGDELNRPKEIVEAQGWSLLGVKADIDTKVKDEECEKKSDDIQAKAEKAVNES